MGWLSVARLEVLNFKPFHFDILDHTWVTNTKFQQQQHARMELFLCLVLSMVFLLSTLLLLCAHEYVEASEDDRVFEKSPVLKCFVRVQKALHARFEPGVAVSCGITAEAVESEVAEFTNTDSASLTDIRPTPFTLYRLHFFVDADNVSDDHVVFLLAARTAIYTFHSYSGILPPRIEKTTWLWLRQAQRMCLAHDTAAWNRIFNLGSQPPVFTAPATISCHCSFAVL